MKMRSLVAPLLLIAALAGCSSNAAGNGRTPAVTSTAPASTPGGTGNSAFCTQLQTALTNVAALASKANDLSAYKTDIAAYAAAFSGLANQAPAAMKGALSDMATALKTLSSALNGAGFAGLSSLSSIEPRLTSDGDQIGHYVAANCAGA